MFRKDPFITGEYYHIYNRGIDKRNIFKSKYDYERFILLLFVASSDSQLRLDNLINHSHKSFKEFVENLYLFTKTPDSKDCPCYR